MKLQEVMTHVRVMLDNRWQHRNKGYVLHEMRLPDMLRHLRDEADELQSLVDRHNGEAPHHSSADYRNAQLELADIFGIVLHLAVALDVEPDELCRLTVAKFRQRFEPPPATPPEEPSRSALISALLADSRLQAQRDTREHVAVSTPLE